MRAFILAISLAAAGSCAPSHPSRLPADLDRELREERSKSVQEDPELQKLEHQESLTEREFLRLVELNNPSLRSLEQEVEAAVARVRQAGLWPNPGLFVEEEESPLSPFRPADGKTVIGLKIPLVLSGRLGAATEAAEKEERAVRHLVQVRRRELLRQARAALYDFLYTREAAVLEEEIRKLTAEFSALVEGRRKEKTVLELEAIQARTELLAQEIEASSLSREVELAAARVRRWTGDPAFDVARIKATLPEAYGVSSLRNADRFLAGHPALAAAALGVEGLEAQLTLAHREGIPDPVLSAAYGRGSDIEGFAREDIVEFGVEIPLPLFNRNQGRIAEIEILRRQALLDYEAIRQDLLTDLRRSALGIDQKLARYQGIREKLLPEALEAVNQASTLYREGKALNLEVLDAQRVLAKVRRTLLEARRDLALSIAQFEALTGEMR